MSVWKGNQLIAANGSPGNDGIPGPPGRDGINGNGVLVVDTCTEISNNVDAHGAAGNTGDNYVNGNQQWCKVGGYHSGLDGSAGQASEVFGYQCHLGVGTGVHVEGYQCSLDDGTQGAHVEGSYNETAALGDGSHLEGYVNGTTNRSSDMAMKRGVHIEGSDNSGVSVRLSDGAHIGGYGLTANTPTLSMPRQRSGYENTYIEAIGGRSQSANGEYARVMRNDGSMAIAGDLAFTAVTSDYGEIRFTLGEIVEILIRAGILTPPV